MIEEPLLLCNELGLRDSDGRIHPFPNLQLTAERVGLVGGWGPLFRLMGGECALVGGTLSIGGKRIPRELGSGRLGVAIRPFAWPMRWTVRDYLTTSSEFAGFGGRGARAAGERALAVLGLARLHSRPLASLSEPEARSVKLAEALITDPSVLMAESPTEDLDADDAFWTLEALRRGSAGRRLIVSFNRWPTTAAGHSLLHSMEKIAQLHDSFAAEGTPDEAATAAQRRYRLVIAEPTRTLVEALQRCGWSLAALPPPTLGAALPTLAPAAAQWTAELPPTETVRFHTEHLQELARSAGTSVLEFVPMHELAEGPAA